ncbi:hypothetical protein EYF80_042006 [Liparis tanakae]|uniref:Uncharacterized protein n=1 Tax=Liparis tanakae TaxID=230148 RepID=A0A4Z2G2R5_9TELE|nr:hypothetical protein EYF80_042006 [Liparis tanakae]
MQRTDPPGQVGTGGHPPGSGGDRRTPTRVRSGPEDTHPGRRGFSRAPANTFGTWQTTVDVNGVRAESSRKASGKFREVQGGSGRFREVLGSPGKFGEVQGSSGKFRDVQGSSGKFREVQGSSGKFREVQGSPGKFREVQGCSRKFREVSESTPTLFFLPLAQSGPKKPAKQWQ